MRRKLIRKSDSPERQRKIFSQQNRKAAEIIVADKNLDPESMAVKWAKRVMEGRDA